MLKEKLVKIFLQDVYPNNLDLTIKDKNSMKLELEKLKVEDKSFRYHGNISVYFTEKDFFPEVLEKGIAFFKKEGIRYDVHFSFSPWYIKNANKDICFEEFVKRDSKFKKHIDCKEIEIFSELPSISGSPKIILDATKYFFKGKERLLTTGHLYYAPSTSSSNDDFDKIRYDLENKEFNPDQYNSYRVPILKIEKTFSRKDIIKLAQSIDEIF